MSGHNRWSQIKHKKGTADQKRGQLFSKLSQLISLAARHGTDPDGNQELKNAIEKARAVDMPKDNIDRAIQRVTEKGAAQLEELTIEVVGPEGSAWLISAITDNRNRTMGELKVILNEHGLKLATPGAVGWMFERSPSGMVAKYPTSPNPELQEKLDHAVSALEEQADVQTIYPNYAHSRNWSGHDNYWLWDNRKRSS